jgi:hypothetical protein
MADFDTLAPNYRRAQQRWPDAPMLAKCREALNACFDGNAHGMVEQVKAFIESVCLTIMGELQEPMPSSTPSTTDLLVAALNPLGLRSSKRASKLDKVLSGFNRLADALSEMRNENGPIAHGKDAFLDGLTADHARAFLHAGDAILGVLLNAFEGKQPDLSVTREPYESFPHLNDRIDRAVNVQARIDESGDRPTVVFSVSTGPLDEAIELQVEPSRLLYGIDRAAYVEVLRTTDLAVAEVQAGEAEIEAPGIAGKIEDDSDIILAATTPQAELVPLYDGRLQTVRLGVEAFLIAEGIDPKRSADEEMELIDSLLATADQNMGLDWKLRAPLLARLKVVCKRVLVQFGTPPEKADEVAERFVRWLRAQIPDTEAEGGGASFTDRTGIE